MKIGICGGTFDPFHRGHLEPVLAARGLLEWDRLIYVPAWRQPFKAESEHASGYHRFTMAVLATETFEEIFVSPQELERGDISYTVETLELLRSQHRDATLDWIIGDDNLAELPKWKKIDRIFELANFAVLTRMARRHDVPAQFRSRIVSPERRPAHGCIVFAENATVPVSSTEIRRRIRAGQPIGDLVDPRVSHYIEHYRLYREAQA
jgi:nicotinate-nucleotide adenylyltransferase